MNKKVSTPIAISIVVLCAFLAGLILIGKYGFFPEKETLVPTPSEKIPEGATPEEKHKGSDYFSIEYPIGSEITVDACFDKRGPILDKCSVEFYLPLDIFTGSELAKPYVVINSWTKFTEEFTSLEDYIEQEEKLLREHFVRLGMFSEFKEEIIILDNVSAKMFSYINKIKVDRRVIEIYVQCKNRMYHIKGMFDVKNENIYLPIFNQILSTFRFLE